MIPYFDNLTIDKPKINHYIKIWSKFKRNKQFRNYGSNKILEKIPNNHLSQKLRI